MQLPKNAPMSEEKIAMTMDFGLTADDTGSVSFGGPRSFDLIFAERAWPYF
jgi:hypothetical protein